MTDPITGVVDRIIDGETAIILLESTGEERSQLEVPVDRLPESARTDGAVLSLTLTDGSLVDATYRPAETSDRRESAGERFDRLSEPLSDRDE